MKHSNLLFLFLIFTIKAFSQKPSIDSTVWDTWPSIGEAKISSKGNFISYSVRYIATQQVRNRNLIIQSADGKWKKDYVNQSGRLLFTENEKYGLFNVSPDSLAIIQLGGEKIIYIPSIKKYNLIQNRLVYITKNPKDELHVLDIEKNKESIIKNVSKYYYSEKNQTLLYILNENEKLNLIWYDLTKAISKNIWRGSNIENLIFNKTETNIAFVSKDNQNFSVWNYNNQINSSSAQEILNNQALGLTDSLVFSRLNAFSDNNELLFLSLKKNTQQTKKTNYINKPSVEVWNYKDQKLGALALNDENEEKSYLAVTKIGSKTVLQLETGIREYIYYNNDIAIIDNKKTKIDSLSNQALFSYSIIHFPDNSISDFIIPSVAPSTNGKFLLYYDFNKKNYFTYEISTGKTTNISKSITTDWTIYGYDQIGVPGPDISEVLWLDNDSNLILHDQYDLWQLDPKGIRSPICLTNHIGKIHSICFFLPLEKSITKDRSIIVPALNRNNKDNGFYRVELDQSSNPLKLTMTPHLYYIPKVEGTPPVKATNANLWLVSKMNSNESLNYYLTKDFKSFKPITNLFPEKKYMWMTSELYTWQDSTGKTIQGILYKPEDFDSTQKYPVIIYYYEKFSDFLHAFIKPEMALGPINIPWFVSRDYLVFVPDIHYTIGEIGKSTINSVVSAATYLSKKSFINEKKIGLQGHSFGGYETNYIITHSNLFAAACSASGISNFISGYNSVSNGTPLQFLYENFQFRMDKTLWETPNKYIENSPIFSLDKVTTPLLIMHTKNDNITLLPQALELFSGLRHLNKKTWLLLYNNASHILHNKSDIVDYTIRLTQFFDYYLKDKPAPLWMLPETPTGIRSQVEGLQLNTTNENP